jgi:hypothetical protein
VSKTLSAKNKKNLYMMTLGCPKNRVDSEVMLGSLQHKGYQLVQEPEAADVIVLGTHERGRLGRLVLGSISRRVSDEASCEVLVVPREPAVAAG